ncbi:MAG: hypothetical protein AAGB11_12430, partial [Pseudomonadota bacterium]
TSPWTMPPWTGPQRDALDLGKEGRDPVFGYGLLQAPSSCGAPGGSEVVGGVDAPSPSPAQDGDAGTGAPLAAPASIGPDVRPAGAKRN